MPPTSARPRPPSPSSTRSFLAQRPNLPPQQSFHHQVKIGGQIRLAYASSCRIGTQYEHATPRERGDPPAHQFPEPSLHPVANHRRANRTADNQAYLRRVTGAYLSSQQQVADEQGAACPAARAQYAAEILRPSHPRLLRQHDTPCAARVASLAASAAPSARALSGAQLGAALAAARGENSPASPGAHAQPETMDLRPPTVVRLERALAHWRLQMQFRDLSEIHGVSLLTVRAIHVQVKPSGEPPAAGAPSVRSRVYHRGTPRFGERVPLRRLRLWKINIHRQVTVGWRPPREETRGTATAHAVRHGTGGADDATCTHVDRPVDNEHGH